MKKLVRQLYSVRGYANSTEFTNFKTDLFANGSTPSMTMNTNASTTGFSITGTTTTGFSITASSTDAFKCATGTFTRGLNLGGTLTTGILINACTTGISITGATTTGISIAGACTTGVTVTAATQLGVNVTIAALTAGDAYSGIRSTVSCLNANNSYGAAGYFETNTTGTQATNFLYGFGSWVNMISGAGKSGGYICAQDNGIYYASGTLTGAKVIFGLRAEVPVSMAAAGRVCMFSANTNNVAITALIDCMNFGDLGSASSKTTTGLYMPILVDNAGAIRYVLLYS
jgi:hypothetical protein